jgi:hypothetical protein
MAGLEPQVLRHHRRVAFEQAVSSGLSGEGRGIHDETRAALGQPVIFAQARGGFGALLHGPVLRITT